MAASSAGSGSGQPHEVTVLTDNSIRNMDIAAIQSAAAADFAGSFQRAKEFIKEAETSGRLTQVLLIEFRAKCDGHVPQCTLPQLDFALTLCVLDAGFFKQKKYQETMQRIGAILRQHSFSSQVVAAFARAPRHQDHPPRLLEFECRGVDQGYVQLDFS
jgi:hypothetical protein